MSYYTMTSTERRLNYLKPEMKTKMKTETESRRPHKLWCLEAKMAGNRWVFWCALRGVSLRGAYNDALDFLTAMQASFGKPWKLADGSLNMSKWRVSPYTTRRILSRPARLFKPGALNSQKD